jgi:PBP1b-binding outer membrane lipoprotein LpoB
MNMTRALKAFALLCVLTLGMAGCSEKATVTKESTVTTPGGKTTVTNTTEVEKSGENPPPAN